MQGKTVHRQGRGSATVIVDGGEMLVAWVHKGHTVVATQQRADNAVPSDAEVLGLIDVLIKVTRL